MPSPHDDGCVQKGKDVHGIPAPKSTYLPCLKDSRCAIVGGSNVDPGLLARVQRQRVLATRRAMTFYKRPYELFALFYKLKSSKATNRFLRQVTTHA